MDRSVKWQLLGLSCTLVRSEWGSRYLHSLNKSSPGQPLYVRYPVQTPQCASVFFNPGKSFALLSRTIQGLLAFGDKCCLKRKDYTYIFFLLSFLWRSQNVPAQKWPVSMCLKRPELKRGRFLHHKVSTDELLFLWLAESLQNILNLLRVWYAGVQNMCTHALYV